MRAAALSRTATPVREQSVARSSRGGVRAPGGIVRRPFVDARGDRLGDSPRRERRRARRARDQGSPTRGVSRRDGRSHDQSPRRDRGADARRAADMDNAYWWIAGDAVTRGRGRRGVRRSGARRPPTGVTPSRPSRRWRGRSRAWCSTWTSSAPSPDVEPYEELLANELRRLERTSSVIVASFHDDAIQRFRSIAPEVSRRRPRRARPPPFFFSLMEDVAPVVAPVCAFQVPATFGDVTVVDERFVDAAHASGRGGARLDDQRGRRDESTARFGRRRHRQRHADAARLAPEGTRLCVGRGAVAEAALAATAVRLLAVVGLLLGA